MDWKFLIQQVCVTNGISISDDRYVEFVLSEIKFRSFVTGRPAGVLEQLMAHKLQPEPELDSVVERDSAVSERDSAVSERDSAVALANLIKQSASWRLTRPLRFVSRLLALRPHQSRSAADNSSAALADTIACHCLRLRKASSDLPTTGYFEKLFG